MEKNRQEFRIEDFLLSSMTFQHRQDLFDTLEDRNNQRNTLVTTQIPLLRRIHEKNKDKNNLVGRLLI